MAIVRFPPRSTDSAREIVIFTAYVGEESISCSISLRSPAGSLSRQHTQATSGLHL